MNLKQDWIPGQNGKKMSGNSSWSSPAFSHLMEFSHWPAPGITSQCKSVFFCSPCYLEVRRACFTLGRITGTRTLYILFPILTPQISQITLLQDALSRCLLLTCTAPTMVGLCLSPRDTSYWVKPTETLVAALQLPQLTTARKGICRRITLCTAGCRSNPASGTSKR